MGLIEQIKYRIYMMYLSNFARHGLSTLGGFLVSAGILSPDAVEPFVSSNVVVVIGLLQYALAQFLSIKSDKKD